MGALGHPAVPVVCAVRDRCDGQPFLRGRDPRRHHRFAAVPAHDFVGKKVAEAEKDVPVKVRLILAIGQHFEQPTMNGCHVDRGGLNCRIM